MSSGGLLEEGKSRDRKNLMESSPQELVASLKAAYSPAMFAELTAYFQCEFSNIRVQSPDLTTLLHSYLLEFKRQTLHPGYSKAFLTAFLSVYPQSELNSVLRTSDLLKAVCTDFTKIEGKAVSLLAKTILGEEIKGVRERGGRGVLESALALWNSKNAQEAVRLAVVFGVQSEFLRETNANETLVSQGNAELAVLLAGDDVARINALVPFLSAKENLKIAGRLIRVFALDKRQFPEICANIKRNAVWYYINSEEVKLWRLAEILEEDLEMMGILIDAMLVSRKAPPIRQLALELLTRYPSLRPRLRGKARDALRQTLPAQVPLIPEDAFAPHDPKAVRYPLGMDTVVMVGSEEELRGVELEEQGVVGFDCEWLPPLISINDSPVSLFQIATRTQTYLLDLHSLHSSPVLDSKLLSLFSNPRVVKVGMSFDGDLDKLRKSCPGFEALKVPLRSFADLHKIVKAFPNSGKGGLAHIAKRFLGQPLCKEEQVSNWNKRPLRLRQLHYAALDSYCEILIWDQMVEERGDKQPPLSSFLTDLPPSSPTRSKQKSF